MLKPIRLFLLSLFILTTSCAGLAPALRTITSAITESSSALRIVEAAFQAYESTHEVQQADRMRFLQLMASAYQTLNTGSRAVDDLKQVDQGKYDQAFQDFRVAYGELKAFLKERGITPLGTGLIGVGTAEGREFEEPRVLTVKIE